MGKKKKKRDKKRAKAKARNVEPRPPKKKKKRGNRGRDIQAAAGGGQGNPPDTMTVLVPGTFSNLFGFWFLPGGLNLHRYLRRFVFPDVYSGNDFFRWNAEPNDDARLIGAEDLIDWCEAHPAAQYNFVAHSHGCNVVSLASNMGLDNINKLVYLSPPVWLDKPGYLPNMDVVAADSVFNFHSRIDRVVTELADPPAKQDYRGSDPVIPERRVIVARGGHFKSVRRRIWIDNDLACIVQGLCF